MVGFADFVKYIADQPDDQRDGHWKSQTGVMCLDRIQYHFIGRVESFSQDFAQVLLRFDAPADLIASLPELVNTTAKVPLAIAYHKELAGLVYTMYQEDFKNFGYGKNSWLIADEGFISG